MTQLLLALFGLSSLYMSQCTKNPRANRWAPVAGLCGQPFWAAFAWQTQAWGLALLVVAFTAVYTRGILVQWGRA